MQRAVAVWLRRVAGGQRVVKGGQCRVASRAAQRHVGATHLICNSQLTEDYCAVARWACPCTVMLLSSGKLERQHMGSIKLAFQDLQSVVRVRAARAMQQLHLQGDLMSGKEDARVCKTCELCVILSIGPQGLAPLMRGCMQG